MYIHCSLYLGGEIQVYHLHLLEMPQLQFGCGSFPVVLQQKAVCFGFVTWLVSLLGLNDTVQKIADICTICLTSRAMF